MTVQRDAAAHIDDLEARYGLALAAMPGKLLGLMRNRSIEPRWIGEGDAFYYVRQTDSDPAGEEFIRVDPVTASRTVHASLDELGIVEPVSPLPGLLASPDGTSSLFLKEHNLWLLDTATGVERQLTHDGVDGFGWGELPDASNMFVPFERMGLVLPPVATVFSPSGHKVLTIRIDQRQMRTQHLVENVSLEDRGRPTVHQIRVQLDDEGAPPPAECLVIDVESGKQVGVDVADGLTTGLLMNGSTEVTWNANESALFILNHRVGGASAAVVEVDTTTGARRDVVVLDEEAPLYEANQFLYSLPLVRILPDTNEAVLFSQRDGWGHLYLYDLVTGGCVNRISTGEIVVRDILRLDEQQRHVTFVASGGGPDINPAWRRLYRARLDGSAQELLTPELADHDLMPPQPQFFHLVFGQGKARVDAFSPSGRFFVDHISTVEDPPVIVLRDADEGGKVILELERTDVARLQAAGYEPPSSFRVKADDGVTDLWGVLSLPARPDDPESIPVVDHIYAGFQTTWTPPSYLGGGKTAGAHGVFSSYNTLGFATVIIDGRGTPGRHRDFRQHTHRHGDTNRGLADHVTAVRALERMFPQLDLDRVGIIGHSYGGYNAARAILMFPEFFKAAVSGAGVHDARKVPYSLWSWFLGADHSRTSDEYRRLGNLHLADRLVGQLLIACGEIDENATVDHSYALADALWKAGKRFDLKIWPGLNHYEQPPYVQVSFWDHFVKHLLGVDVPVSMPALEGVATPVEAGA